ncbi:hypothetical protein KQI82_07435 [Oscillibacter sp. MSJ-2]|uniref:Uncharacterized protein n=1 Tax=Dysosmobacter acutus TaxID=2841504 RepID=A0ABS6F903_9FIRM|nr:hypothetical protein [Dysosmobacter acutus]MBU5626745.1 hypothetical protein [Dysosmobacter acutus]
MIRRKNMTVLGVSEEEKMVVKMVATMLKTGGKENSCTRYFYFYNKIIANILAVSTQYLLCRGCICTLSRFFLAQEEKINPVKSKPWCLICS